MSIDNGSFETPGTSAWLADGWTSTFVYSGWAIADFGVDSPLSVETFGPGWALPEYFTAIVGINAPFDMVWVPEYLFTPNGFESFLHWRRFSRRTSILSSPVMFYYQQTDEYLPMERFTSGWSNNNYVTGIGGQDFWESFLSWMPDPYNYDTIGGTPAPIGSGEGPVTVEYFTDIRPDTVFAADPDTNTCFAPNHFLIDEEPVFVLSTGTRPGGLAQNIQYYVIFVSTTYFQLSKTPGGSAITITDPGTGTHSVRVDQTKFWTTTIG